MKKNQRFSVRRGFHISQRVAQDVGPVILSLIEQGKYTPRALVEAARSPKNPAHKHFIWNDKQAAEQHRLERALFFQRAIEYEFVVRRGNKKPVDLIMRVAYPDGAGNYHSGGAVITSRALTEHLLRDALERLESWRNQYEMLRDKAVLSGIFSEIDRLMPPPKGSRQRRKK